MMTHLNGTLSYLEDTHTNGTTFGICGSPSICESARSHPLIFARPSPLASFLRHACFRCQFESPTHDRHRDQAFQTQDVL